MTFRIAPRTIARRAVCGWLLGVAWASSAAAYVGDSFLNIPGSTGHWRGREYANWIRVEANDWPGILRRMSSGSGDFLAGDKLFFGGPGAARPNNAGKLVVVLSKDNPDVHQLISRCAERSTVPEMIYAESSDRSRPPLELGPRPAEFPAYWEYKLKDVEINDCPVVAEAPQQAFVLSFADIEWLNYDPDRPRANKIIVKADDLPDVQPIAPSTSKKVRSFLITWIAPATDAADDQCPIMNTKPSDAEFFRYVPRQEEARLRARNGEKGMTFGLQTELRGPHGLNAVLLPGIVPDPGFAEPQSKIAYGLDLDADDGSGPPPAGICKHRNYVSVDGRSGIDNQYYSVVGCVTGFRGKKGYANQTSNARRADGNITTLMEVSGIDDEQNDDHVDVALIHSMDKPIRDNAGAQFIPHYTFRPTDDPNFALYNRRLSARIVQGVITTDRVSLLQLNLGQNPLLELFEARMRVEIRPDGSLRGILAGYIDWKRSAVGSGYSEGLFGFQQPGLYNALRRNADGLKDPITGECNGISIAYEIDGVPAFLTGRAPKSVGTRD